MPSIFNIFFRNERKMRRTAGPSYWENSHSSHRNYANTRNLNNNQINSMDNKFVEKRFNSNNLDGLENIVNHSYPSKTRDYLNISNEQNPNISENVIHFRITL